MQPHFVAGGTDSFAGRSQQCYLRWGLSDEPRFTLPPADRVPPAYPELDEDLRFASVTRRRHEAEQRYTAAEWVGLLSTDSLVLGLGFSPAPAPAATPARGRRRGTRRPRRRRRGR